MPRRKNGNKMIQVSILSSDHKIFLSRKAFGSQPIYEVINRMVTNYLNSDKGEMEETITKQSKIIGIYFDRIKDLESQLERQKKLTQTVFQLSE